MKQLVKNYTFSASGKTITLSDFSSVAIARLYIVTDVTAGTIIYQFNNSNLGGTASGNVISLTYDTTSLSSSDKLQIIYDCATGDPTYDSPNTTAIAQGNVASGVADSGNPVKIGAVYNATAPSLINGQRGDLQVDTAGRLLISPAPLSSATDSISVTSSTSTGVAAPTTAYYIAQKNSSGNLTGIQSPTTAYDGGNGEAVLSAMPFAYNGSTYDRLRTPLVTRTATTSVSGATAVWTPQTGKKFRLMRYMIEVTGNAAQSTASSFTIKLQDSSTDMAQQHTLYIPSTASTAMGNDWCSPWIDLGNGTISVAANNVLNVNLAATLSSGLVRIITCGTEE